jgi:chemosensory pili system protein ChpC
MNTVNPGVDLSAVLLPVTGRLLVVPSSVIAEIIKQRELSPPAGGPAWLLGTLKWHQQAVPVISFEAINGSDVPDTATTSRVVILSTISEGARYSHYAIPTQGVPHLLRLTVDDVKSVDGATCGPAERLRVLVYGQHAAIPDLDHLEHHLAAL